MRKSNFDFLKILSILMVIFLHTLLYSGVMEKNFLSNNMNYIFLNIIYASCSGAVTLFILITGYFSLANIDFNIKKNMKIYIQMIFYSLAIPVVFIFLGIEELSLGLIIRSLIPFLNQTWWFVTGYICLMLLIPYINRMLNSIDIKEFEKLLVLIFLFFFLWPTLGIIPGINPIIDDSGYGLVTMSSIYIIGVYLRKTKKSRNINKYIYLLIFLLGSLSIATFNIIISYKTGLVSSPFSLYNNIFVLISACSLFLFFEKLDNITASKKIAHIATLSLGIYFIHEHFFVREYIYNFIDIEANNVLIQIFIFAITVFIIAGFIEYFRISIFRMLPKAMREKNEVNN